MDTKVCPDCGAARADRFCGSCGLDFSSHEPDSLAPAEAVPEDVHADAPSLPEGLTYGHAFDPEGDCPNCGTPMAAVGCELCADEETDEPRV